MKKTVLAFAVAFLATATMGAQDAHRRGGDRQAPSAEEMIGKRIEMMTKGLNLTEEQQNKVREILTDEMNYEGQMRQMLMKRKKQSEAKIAEVLTDEQKEKQKEMHKRMGMRGPGPQRMAQHQHAEGACPEGAKHECEQGKKECDKAGKHECAEGKMTEECKAAKHDCEKGKKECDKAGKHECKEGKMTEECKAAKHDCDKAGKKAHKQCDGKHADCPNEKKQVKID